jgi:hypothetical protein
MKSKRNKREIWVKRWMKMRKKMRNNGSISSHPAIEYITLAFE